MALESFEGIVLDKRFRGESGLLLKVFSKEEGIVVVHKRVSQKKANTLPDLFDNAAFSVQVSKTGGLYFLTNFETSKSRTAIANDYGVFFHACQISKFIQKNSQFLEKFGELFSYLDAVLDALAQGADSAGVRVKFLYAFAKSEGYAVKEDFAQNLSQDEFNALKNILAQSVKNMKCEALANSLLNKLNSWLSENTDFVLPD